MAKKEALLILIGCLGLILITVTAWSAVFNGASVLGSILFAYAGLKLVSTYWREN